MGGILNNEVNVLISEKSEKSVIVFSSSLHYNIFNMIQIINFFVFLQSKNNLAVILYEM